MFHGISHLPKDEDREECHALLLIGRELLVERFPRICELVQVCCALGKGIGTSMQGIDRIAVAQGLKTAIT